MKDLKSFLSKKMGAPEKTPKAEKKQAKMNVLKDLQDAAKEDMAEKMGSFKKVSVMAPDAEGLKKGLEKAEDIVETMPEMEESEEESDESEMEDSESEDEGDKDTRIAMLEEKLAQMQEMLASLKK